MARRKKTEYDAATSASDKHIGSQELKQVKEQFSDEQKYNFTTAINVLHQFRDITKSYRKSIATFDKEQLIGYLKNIGSNENNLEGISAVREITVEGDCDNEGLYTTYIEGLFYIMLVCLNLVQEVLFLNIL